MQRTTFRLELLAMLTLLAVTKEGYCQWIGPKIQDLKCRWLPCKERLMCTFDQLETEPAEVTNIHYNLTLNEKETVICQQAYDNITKNQCVFEDF